MATAAVVSLLGFGVAHSLAFAPGGALDGFIESTLISAFGGPRKEGEDPDARYVGGHR